jgi:amino acid transporter
MGNFPQCEEKHILKANLYLSLCQGKWDVATFVTNYLPFVLFPILYAAAKYYYWRRGKPFAWTRPQDLDFVTNIAEIEADS